MKKSCSYVSTWECKLADMGEIKKKQLHPLQLYLSSVDLKSPDQYCMWSSVPLYLQLPCEILIGSESSGKPAPAKCSSVKYSSKASDLIVVQLWGFTSSLHPVEDKQVFKHLQVDQRFKESGKAEEAFLLRPLTPPEEACCVSKQKLPCKASYSSAHALAGPHLAWG